MLTPHLVMVNTNTARIGFRIVTLLHSVVGEHDLSSLLTARRAHHLF